MAKKVILFVVGGVLMICGLGALVPGALLTRVTRGDGALDSGYHTIGSPTPALVSPTEKVNDSDLPTSGPGAATLTVSARDSAQPVFLGVAPAADVDAYLSGVAYDEVRDFQVKPYRVQTSRHSGDAFASPPGEESFWLASATGTNPTLDWKVQDGAYRLVLMNADGSPGAAADTQIGVKVSGLHGLGVGIVASGAVAALVGLGLVFWGLRTPAHRPQPAGAPGSYPPASGPPAPAPEPAPPSTPPTPSTPSTPSLPSPLPSPLPPSPPPSSPPSGPPSSPPSGPPPWPGGPSAD